jgi:hypothetical protein
VISVKDGNMRFELQEITQEFMDEGDSPDNRGKRSMTNTAEVLNLESFNKRNRSMTSKPYVLADSSQNSGGNGGLDSLDDFEFGNNQPPEIELKHNVTSLNQKLTEELNRYTSLQELDISPKKKDENFKKEKMSSDESSKFASLNLST